MKAANLSAADHRPVTAAQPLPSGIVTFAFTDIEGSAQRWDRHGAAMQHAVRRHDALMRAAITEHGGSIFKTIGDAFCAAFSRPENAISAMLDVQRSLRAEDFSEVDGLSVRVAIHTGTADERDCDYFGSAVNRVARLLAIGHGGQILVSGVTTDIVQGSLPSQASLRNLGEHRLRDLARPEQVYQLLAPQLASDFPPLRSLDELPNNLPLQLKSFVGRETEISEITLLLDKHRLVTLVDSAGVGKTRTSLQIAANALDAMVDGVWFVELAPLQSGDFIASTVAQALGIVLAPDGEPVANLARALKFKHLLLVFDNCEHLVEPAAQLISTILRECPKVKVLASSRQSLGIEGEETYRMPSLSIALDGDSDRVPAAIAVRFEAIALFVDRALAVDKRFKLTDENAPAVAVICRRLDGIPLAIELAASRVKMLSPNQLRDRLDERFQVLTGGSRDVLPRQQTLRAMIDWSYNFLEERERMLFRRLGMFGSAFTLEGAAAVGADSERNDLDTFDLLASLVDKSLVLAEPDGDSLRYRLLESTRMYALEKLSASHERELIAGRHLQYFCVRFTELRAHADQTAQRTQLNDALASQLADVRTAIDVALAGGDLNAGGALLAAIGRGWEAINFARDGIVKNQAMLAALPRSQTLLLARIASTLADMLNHAGSTERGLELAIEAIAYARVCGDVQTLAEALDHYALLNLGFGKNDEAERALLEAEALPSPTAALRMHLLFTRARLEEEKGNFNVAERMWEQLQMEHRAIGNTREEVVSALCHAEVKHARGHTQQAIALVRQLSPKFLVVADKAVVANMLGNLAAYLLATGDHGAASVEARAAIRLLADRDPEHSVVSFSIERLALAAALHGDYARAALLEGHATATIRRMGHRREVTEWTTYNQLTPLLREGLESGELARLTDEGAALIAEAAIALALEQ